MSPLRTRLPLLVGALLAGSGLLACANEEQTPEPDASDATDTADSADGGDVEPDTDDAGDASDAPPDSDDVADTADTTDVADTADATDSGTDTDTVDPDADDASDDVDSATDTDASDVDPDVLDACLAACGVGCVAAEYAPCGVDGNLYCSECEMECRGIAEAPDRSVCDPEGAACDPPADAEVVAWAEWTPPGDCYVPTMGTRGSLLTEVFESEASLEGVLDCAVPNTPSGIDWGTHRLVRAVFFENPTGELRGVSQQDGRVTVHLAAPVYCGGAAPPDSAVYVLLPTSGDPVEVNECRYGRCPDGPPRP